MRCLVLTAAVLTAAAGAMAQSEPVMIDDLTTTEVQAAIDAGKTTAIYYAGGTHQNGEAVALGKHNLIARHVSERVARELGNALAYPNPYAPAGDPIAKTGHMRFAGTVSVSEETFAAVTRDVVVSAIAVGFRHVVLLGDHGGEEQVVLREAAESLDAEWRLKGARVFFIPVYEEGEARMREYLATLDVERNRMTPTDDASEILAVAPDRVRRALLAEDVARVASAEVGRALIQGKVDVAVAHIRAQVGNGQAANGWTVPRTADGQPDLQGVWASDSATPLERPEQLADRATLTEEEVATLQARAAELFDGETDAAFGDSIFRAALTDQQEYKSGDGVSEENPEGTGNYNQFWLIDRWFDDRTSLIVDRPASLARRGRRATRRRQ